MDADRTARPAGVADKAATDRQHARRIAIGHEVAGVDRRDRFVARRERRDGLSAHDLAVGEDRADVGNGRIDAEHPHGHRLGGRNERGGVEAVILDTRGERLGRRQLERLDAGRRRELREQSDRHQHSENEKKEGV